MKNLRLCGECGFSKALARTTSWNSSGTITVVTDPGSRIILMESDTYTRLFDRLGEYLGMSIQRIVFEAMRTAASASIESVLRGPMKTLRWTPFGKRVMVTFFCQLSQWLGEGYAKVITYRKGKKGRAIIRNPYQREMMAATVVGSFEALERRSFSHSWEEADGEEVICIRPAEEGTDPDLAQRLAYTAPPPKPGRRIWERCSRCGAPLALDYLEWRKGKGEIIDSRTGYRMVFLPLHASHVVFRELEVELGKGIYPVVEEAQYELSLRNISAEFIETGLAGTTVRKDVLYRKVLDSLPLNGLGNPVEYQSSDGRLSVILENPFNEHLIAGHLRALFELGEGRKAACGWELIDPFTMSVELVAE